MIHNYLITILRNFKAQKFFNLLNLGGLTLGITAFLLISLYVQKELSFDQFFTKKEQIFRLNLKEEGVSERTIGLTTIRTGDELKAQLPEIERMVRIEPYNTSVQLIGEEILLDNKKLVFAEPAFFQLFDFPLLKGDANTVLNEPNTVVLSANFAQQLFGDKDPIGKLLEVKGKSAFPLKVTGIVADVQQSHITYDAFVSWETSMENGKQIKDFFAYSVYTYFQLASNDIGELETKINQVATENNFNPEEQITYTLQSLEDIYLHSNHIQFIGPFKIGSAQNIQLFSIIGFIILLVSILNYVNLTTAKNSNRALEVGIRKFLGANKLQLMLQFVGETFVSVSFAAILAIVLLYLLLPYFNNIVGTQLLIIDLLSPRLLLIGILVILSLTLFSGIYPAMVAAGFSTSGVLKNSHVSNSKGSLLRKVLTTVHFSISIVLVIGSLIVAKQYQFLMEKPLGFNQEQMVVIDIGKSASVSKNHESFKAAINQLPGVLASSIGTDDLGSGATNNSGALYPVNGNGEGVLTTIFGVDADFMKAYEIDLLEGRSFNPELETDQDKLIVNGAFLKAAGWEDVLDKQIAYRQKGQPYEVIGVVKDFHFRSLHHEVSPVVIRIAERNFWKHAVLIEKEAMESSLAAIEATWQQFEPLVKVSYSFVDDEFAKFYKKEKLVSKLVLMFTILSIVIALLGLFGLSSYQAIQRYKEIGIRKTLGASTSTVLSMFVFDISKLLIIAIFIAIPFANFIVGEWLKTFSYRLHLTIWHFIIPIILVSLISMATVLIHSLKAARIKIVDAIRD